MKRFTLTNGGSVWIDLKAITAIEAYHKEKPEVWINVSGPCHVVSAGDINAETFAENLAAEIDDAKNSVTVEAKPFDGAPLPDKNGAIVTKNNYLLPLTHLCALYIKGDNVCAVYNGIRGALHRFNNQKDAQAYFNELVAHSGLTKVTDRVYVNKDTVKDVIVERGPAEVKIVVDGVKVLVNNSMHTAEALDLADKLKAEIFGKRW